MPDGTEALCGFLLVPLTQEMTHETVNSSRTVAGANALYV
jgi:hypothetical protein